MSESLDSAEYDHSRTGSESLPPRRATSLQWRLPLLMSGVLAVMLVAALAVTYATLARSAARSADDRLHRVARQLATVAASGVRRGGVHYDAVGRDSVIRRALRAAGGSMGRFRLNPEGDSLVRTVLERVTSPADSGMPVELWSAGGRRIARFGTEVRSASPEGDDSAIPDSATITHVDSLTLTPLYASNGRVHYWVIAPIHERGGVPLGYIVQQKRIMGGPQAEQTIRELSGDSVTAYYRNRVGGLWSTLAGVPTTPPVRDSARGNVVFRRPGVGEILTAEEHVERTPLAIVVELARRQIFAESRATVLTLGVLSFALLGIGAALVWLVSRRVTRPIGGLTAAAEAIARGDYSARAEVAGYDEVARLAASFNQMGREIAGVNRELERQSAEARATASELAASNTALIASREAAEAASRAKSDFLAMMSHELRTPLNAIGGYTELMVMGIRGPVTEAQRRDLERIRANQQHLLGLISAVLDLSRIERGQVAYAVAPLALHPFLASIDALVAPQAAARKVTLEYVPCDGGLVGMADGEKFRQILLNLLSNAIRCTPPGGAVTVEACAVEGTIVKVTVRDTGIGIPASKQAQIFEPFVQLDRSLTQIREGIGLGLAISRDLARGMGGDLTVESVVGAGSCFTVTLPLGAVDAAEPMVVGLEVLPPDSTA